MSKRLNEDINKSAPPAKKIITEQEKAFECEQGYVNFEASYLSAEFCDVKFIFLADDGITQTIPAHKYLLAMRSEVFAKMFYGETKQNGDVNIVGVSEAAFKEFLKFFYLKKVKFLAKHIPNVLVLGHKYNVKKCIDACSKFLTEDRNICVENFFAENVCAILSVAIECNQNELIKMCEKQIVSNTAEIFKSAGFLKCKKNVLAHILQMNVLSSPEVDVFKACMQWVKAKSEPPILSKAMVEKHLAELYHQIRFKSMGMAEFFELEKEYKYILKTDSKAIIDLFGSDDANSGPFNESLREVKWNDDEGAQIKCDRDNYQDCKNTEYYFALDIEEKSTFSTTEPLLLGEFTCHDVRVRVPGDKNKSEMLDQILNVDVKITEARSMDDAKPTVLSNVTTQLGLSFATVQFPKPILIRPGFFYTIYINGFSEDHCCASMKSKAHVELETGTKINFHDKKGDCLINTLVFNSI